MNSDRLIYCKIGITINFRLIREEGRMAKLAKALVKEKRVNEKKGMSRQRIIRYV